ncbi:MAG: hypothetical protein ACLR4Z_05340 [Butyricicoccaceae bacterium]
MMSASGSLRILDLCAVSAAFIPGTRDGVSATLPAVSAYPLDLKFFFSVLNGFAACAFSRLAEVSRPPGTLHGAAPCRTSSNSNTRRKWQQLFFTAREIASGAAGLLMARDWTLTCVLIAQAVNWC